MHPTRPASSGLLWKVPWRLSDTRQRNVRKRLRQVDSVIRTLLDSGVQCRQLDEIRQSWKWEKDMQPREKYWVFERNRFKEGYKKPVHKVPKWTKIDMPRSFPKGF